jgi:hypothetical protein
VQLFRDIAPPARCGIVSLINKADRGLDDSRVMDVGNRFFLTDRSLRSEIAQPDVSG